MKDADDVTALFHTIRQKALALGVTDSQLASLPAVRELKVQGKLVIYSKLAVRVLVWLLLALLSLSLSIGASLTIEWPYTRESVVRLCFGLDHTKDDCILEVPDYVLDFARPPTGCDFCKDVFDVDRVSALTREEFEQRYAYTGRPVVVLDAAKNWTALKTFSLDFFKQIYGEDSPVLKNNNRECMFFGYKTDFENLKEVFQMSASRSLNADGSEPWYIGWSNCDSSAANVLRHHYTTPYFLPTSAQSSRTDWIFMGSPGHGAHMHVDDVHDPSWQTMIRGTKRWRLVAPPECYHECGPPIDVIVNPGETIVIDTNVWYHSTLIIGNEMSIAIGSEYD